jgi:hypothetical protein
MPRCRLPRGDRSKYSHPTSGISLSIRDHTDPDSNVTEENGRLWLNRKPDRATDNETNYRRISSDDPNRRFSKKTSNLKGMAFKRLRGESETERCCESHCYDGENGINAFEMCQRT